MPISNTYVAQHLLTETRCGAIVWRESENGGYVAESNGVDLHLSVDQSRTGRRVFVTVSRGLEKAHLAEPLSTGVLRARYADADQMNLANLLHELVEAVEVQCARREKAAREAAPLIRDALFRQLLFAESASGAVNEEFLETAGKRF